MADYNLGTAKGRVVIDYDGAPLDRAKKDVEGVGTKSAEADKRIGQLGTGMTVAGAAVAGGLAVAAKSAIDFEKRLSGIKAVSGATTSEMETIRAKALQLGKDTAFSAGESAMAIEELVKAGISVADVMGGAADATVSLAAAGGVDLVTAATISSNALNAFNLEAKDMTGVVDSIAGAANASAIDVGEFGQSLSQVGAVANLVGLSFDDTAVAIAEMGNAGIKGSDAGTSLKTMLMNLQPQTKAQTGQFRQLGLLTFNAEKAMEHLRAKGIQPLGTSQEVLTKQLGDMINKTRGIKPGSAEASAALEKLTNSTAISDNAFFDAQGNIKSLRDIQDALQKSTANLTDEQKTMALEVLFGSDAVRAAAVLTKEGAAGFDALSTSMNKTSAADVAKTRLDNLAGRMEEFKGSLETLGITLGTVLIPALTKLTEKLTGVLNWFLELNPETQKAIVIFLGILAGLLLLGGALIKVVSFVKALHGVFLALKGLAWLRTFMTFLFGPWGLAIAAIIALVYLIYKNWDTIKEFLIRIWTVLKDAFQSLVDYLSSAWESFSSSFMSAWNAVWSAVSGFFMAIWGAIAGFLTGVFDVIVGIITTYVNFWRSIIEGALGIIKGIWEAFWGVFGGVITAVFDLIKAVIELGMKLATYAIQVAVHYIKLAWNAAWDFVADKVRTAMEFVKGVITAVLGFITPYVTTAVNAVRNVITSVWEFISSRTRAVWFLISSLIRGVWESITGFVQSGVDRVMGWIRVLSSIAQIIGTYFHNAYVAVVDRINAIIHAVGNIAHRVWSAVGNLGSLLYGAGQQIIQGLINGIESMIRNLVNRLNFLTSLIPDNKGPASKDKVLLEENGRLIMQGLIRGITGQVPTLERVLGGLTTSIPVTVGAGVSASPSLVAAAPSGSGDTYQVGEVVIPAKDLAEMQDVSEFFSTIRQSARKKVGAV